MRIMSLLLQFYVTGARKDTSDKEDVVLHRDLASFIQHPVFLE